MLPDEQGPPPGLADMFGGMGPDEEPDEIDVTPHGAADEEPDSGIDPDEQAILDALQDLIRKNTDADYQAKVGKIAADLAKVMADNENADMSAMGGNPKQMRAMNKAYAG